MGLPSRPTNTGSTLRRPAIRLKTTVASNGRTLSGGKLFHKIDPGYCDGMRVDQHGNVWSSAADGVHCLDRDGKLLGKVRVPHRVSNLTFGGPAKNRLFIAGSGTLYSIFLNCRGAQTP